MQTHLRMDAIRQYWDQLQPKIQQLLDVAQENPILKKVVIFAGITASFMTIRWIYLTIYHKKYKSVPTLFGVPVFGSLFTAAYYGKEFLNKLLPSYGPISKFYFAKVPVTIISDQKLMREIFKSQLALNRP